MGCFLCGPEFRRPYGRAAPVPQALPIFYQEGGTIARPEIRPGRIESACMVAGIAIAMFIGLFGWGADYFGWHDPTGKIQLALVTSFILGAVASYKARG
jgi:hypothetical protein